MEIKRRHVLRKNDFRELKEQLRKTIGESVENLFQKNAEIIVTEEFELFAEKKEILAFKYKDTILPSLKAINKSLVEIASITVDMGAVPFVTNGADIMAPGITEIPEGLKANDFVAIIDENFGKSLAIGQLLFDGDKIKEMNKGKVVKNIHYIDDDIWKLEL